MRERAGIHTSLSRAVPRAPLCENRPTGPSLGLERPRSPINIVSTLRGSYTPMQFGPMIRHLYSFARRTISFYPWNHDSRPTSASIPSFVPVSRKPPGTMVTHLAPRSRHCFSASTVNFAEIEMTTPSILSGISEADL